MIIAREVYLETLKERLKDFPIVALSGPRQAGKTTLARHYADSLPPEVEAHFFDLESPSALARLRNPELALAPLKGLVVLDEIQRKPELFPLLRVLADRSDRPARFLLLGSAASALIGDASESLAGRISFIDVAGFSLAEVGAEKLKASWWRGGFPPAFLGRTDAVARQWHEDFIRTFLERDIPQLGISIPAHTLRRFWTMVAHYHGQTLKLSELARSLGSSEPTARRYLDILSGTFMVRPLPPWFENLKKRQVKAPKIYLRDSGIAHTLLGIPDHEGLQAHPKLGASWEGYCIEQILSVTGDREAYFWATHAGAELDLLLFHQGHRIGVECKYSEQPAPTKSMRIALADLGLEHLFVVYPGHHRYPLEEKLTATPLPELLEILGTQQGFLD